MRCPSQNRKLSFGGICVQLAVGELADPAEGVAGGAELLDHGVEVDVVRGVAVVVLVGAVVTGGVVLGSVAEGAEESRDAMPAVRGWLVGG